MRISNMLYNVNASEIIKDLTNQVKENYPDLSDAKAKKLVLNALLSNFIADEIMGQVDFLIENDGYNG